MKLFCKYEIVKTHFNVYVMLTALQCNSCNMCFELKGSRYINVCYYYYLLLHYRLGCVVLVFRYESICSDKSQVHASEYTPDCPWTSPDTRVL